MSDEVFEFRGVRPTPIIGPPFMSEKKVNGDQVCVDFLTQQPVLRLGIIADSSVTEELLPSEVTEGN